MLRRFPFSNEDTDKRMILGFKNIFNLRNDKFSSENE